MQMSDTVKFWAVVSKVQTLADGGIRVTLDLGEDAIVAAAELMTLKRSGIVLDVTCTARREDESEHGNTRKSTY